MNIQLERIDDALGFRATSGRHSLLLDGSPDDQGFRPMHLMLVALAGCSAMDVVSILQKGRHAIRSYRSSVEADRREELPRIFSAIVLRIEVDTDAPDSALERAVELTRTKYCSAFAVLACSAEVTLEISRTHG